MTRKIGRFMWSIVGTSAVKQSQRGERAGADEDVRAAAHRGLVTIVDAPVVAAGRLELRWYLREQTVAQVVHRYGNLIEPSPP
jgi:RHH-type transcriptional regulator, proline utilization regulon repressor / proline dehydrogenase / delta 1-pyrroline-5-carboxylate dehydrogenase